MIDEDEIRKDWAIYEDKASELAGEVQVAAMLHADAHTAVALANQRLKETTYELSRAILELRNYAMRDKQ